MRKELLASSTYCTFSGGENVGLEVVADDGSVLFSQSGFSDFAIIYLDVCLQDGTCYTATLTDLSGTGMGWNGGYFWVSDGYQDLVHEELTNGQVTSTVEFSLDGTCEELPSNDIYGCTDPAAWNFNPWATIDDGSCLYDNGEVYGCTDPVATNYNPDATVDDSSCIFPSIYDGISDVLLISTAELGLARNHLVGHQRSWRSGHGNGRLHGNHARLRARRLLHRGNARQLRRRMERRMGGDDGRR